jgi:DnaK suppressor protein
MNKAFLLKVKNILLSEKDAIMKQTKRDVDIDTDGDETDEIQAGILIDINNQLTTRNSEKLVQIAEALHRVDNKTYGLCLDCGEMIPEKRLLINPYFQTCISCAEEREAEVKQRKRA